MITSFQKGFSDIKDSETWRKVQIQLEGNESKVQPSGSEKKGRLMKIMRNKTLKHFMKFVNTEIELANNSRTF